MGVATYPALAQQPARSLPERLGTGSTRLLNRRQVQEELKLTEEQVKQLKEISQKMIKQMEELKDLKGPTRFDKMVEKFREADEAVSSVLRPEQRKRLKQLALQMQGLRALATPEVAKELSLTDEQKKKIQEALEGARKQAPDREDFDTPEFRAEARQRMAELMKKTREKVLAMLTDEQRVKWKEMLGEPFKGDFGPASPGGQL
jgi:Spy/CpxP family protein refolding chaperone